MLRRHPDDPFAVNHFLAVVLFRELYRMGALNTGEYTNDTFIRAAHRPADPKVKQQIQELVQRPSGSNRRVWTQIPTMFGLSMPVG